MSSGYEPEEVTSEGNDESILQPQIHDVLSGRGNYVNYHPGNEHFRNLVKKYKKAYVACPKSQKGKFSRLIVDQIFAMDPPGRFLKKDEKSNQWGDIGEKKALDKTRQALREGAPELVRELTGPATAGTTAGSSDEEASRARSAKPIKHEPIPYQSIRQQTIVDNYPHVSHSQAADYHRTQMAAMHMQAQAHMQSQPQSQVQPQAQNNSHAIPLAPTPYSQAQSQYPYPNDILSSQDLGQQYIPQSHFPIQPQEVHSMPQFTPVPQVPNTATPDRAESAFITGLDTNYVKVSYPAQQFEPTPIQHMLQNTSAGQYGQDDLVTLNMPLPETGTAEKDTDDGADQDKEEMRETGSAASLKLSDLQYRNPKPESSGNMSFSITDLEKGNLSSMFSDSLIITTGHDDGSSGRISSEKSGSTTLSESKDVSSIVRKSSYVKKNNQSSTISGMSFGMSASSGSDLILDSVQNMSFTNFDDSMTYPSTLPRR